MHHLDVLALMTTACLIILEMTESFGYDLCYSLRLGF